VSDTDCICTRFADTGGFRIADLACPVHGVDGTDPGDGMWVEGDGTGEALPPFADVEREARGAAVPPEATPCECDHLEPFAEPGPNHFSTCHLYRFPPEMTLRIPDGNEARYVRAVPLLEDPQPPPKQPFETPDACVQFTLFCMTDGDMTDAERRRLAAGVLDDLAIDGWTVTRDG
jgi:hypothetical protein